MADVAAKLLEQSKAGPSRLASACLRELGRIARVHLGREGSLSRMEATVIMFSPCWAATAVCMKLRLNIAPAMGHCSRQSVLNMQMPTTDLDHIRGTDL